MEAPVRDDASRLAAAHGRSSRPRLSDDRGNENSMISRVACSISGCKRTRSRLRHSAIPCRKSFAGFSDHLGR